MGWAIAAGQLAGCLGMLAGAIQSADSQVEIRQEVVDVGQLETVTAAVGDAQGFLGEMARLLDVSCFALPACPGEEDVRLNLRELDPEGSSESFGEVNIGFG